MKSLTLSLCFSALTAFGQSATPATPLAAQPANKPAVSPDTVVLKVGGKPITAAEFDKLIAMFSPEIQQSAKANPRQVIQSYYVMDMLARQGEQEKLDQSSPVKETLQLQRMQTLATAVVNRQNASIAVSEDEELKRYEAEKERQFGQVRARGIFIQFADPKAINAKVDMSNVDKPKVESATGLRMEAEAKTIVDDIAKQVKAGADFAALAKAQSEDKTTGAKGGEYPMLHQTDRIPDDIKKAVFALKPGEMSDPIRQPNGFFLFKVEDRSIQPFAEVKQLVANQLKQERFQKWMSDLQKQYEVTVENPEFFGARPLPRPGVPSAPATVPPTTK